MLFTVGEAVIYTHACPDFNIDGINIGGVFHIENKDFADYHGIQTPIYMIGGMWVPEKFLAPLTLRVGHYVKVVKKVSKEFNWNNLWSADMSALIGMVACIQTIDQYGVHLHGYHYGFPIGSLQFVHTGHTLKKTAVLAEPTLPDSKPIIYLD